MNIQTLIFDLDGTLIDSCEDIAASLNYTLAKLGYPDKSRSEVEALVGDGAGVLLAKASSNSDPAFIEKALTIFKPHYKDHCVDRTALYPGVLEVLENF